MSAESQKEILDPPNKRQTLSRLVIEASQKFKIKPSQEYLGHVVNLLDRSLKLFEAERLLISIPKTYDTFPSLSQIEENIVSFRTKAVLSSYVESLWVSKQAPGTPASIEALFILIRRGHTDNAAFRMGLQRTSISEENLWLWYQAWTEGKIHPDLQLRRENLLKPWSEALAEKSLK